MSSMKSIYDLVYSYIDIFYEDDKMSKEQKKAIHKEIKKLLGNGWCSCELYKGFQDIKRKFPEKQTLKVSQLFTSKRPIKKNLLEQGRFYYHNNLRLTSSPPKREIDYDSGDVTVINDPYFLEMKASYSVEDLTKYFMRQVGGGRPSDVKRYQGSLTWMLKSFDLEEILFMIDMAVNTARADDSALPDSPLDTQKAYKPALVIIDLKKTETIVAGGNKIVRKKRTRTS